MGQESTYHECMGNATNQTDAKVCLEGANKNIVGCTAWMFDYFYYYYPKAKIFQTGYDIPCENALCKATVDQAFTGTYCDRQSDYITCVNTLFEVFQAGHHDALAAKYNATQYVPLNMLGTNQMAAGIPGAAVGKPVLSQSAKCEWEWLCVHPTYGTPAATAWGQAMWDLFFSKQKLPTLGF